MVINKEQTQEYYKNYEPCTCSDCKNYYLQIQEKYPQICEYLETLGINPVKPFELIPMDDENSDFIDYICQYVIFGTCEEKLLKKINDIEITLNEGFHPDTQIEQDHFVIDFGPISLPKKRSIFQGILLSRKGSVV